MQADSIKIECDEDGFWLNLTLDEDIPADLWDALGESYGLRVRIHNCAEALHEQVNLIIGGWLAEGERARREVDSDDRADFATNAERDAGVFFCNPDESGGLRDLAVATAYDTAYEINDPKHPDYHSIHADHYDSRLPLSRGGR